MTVYFIIFGRSQIHHRQHEYNELMAEYYNRIDYCLENFSTLTGLKGTETDRARIYILNGKPSNIERGSNSQGKISETWRYIKISRRYLFLWMKREQVNLC